VISLDREEINASGAGTIADFLRTLPQVFGGGPSEDTHYFTQEALTNSGLGSGINLRGLGARSTLVLMDGKRLAMSGDQAEFADIENIPGAAVERVDILPDSASALYGADAVGGVVNFVMRDNFTGAETFARAGTGTGNTLHETVAAQNLGRHWDSGNAMLSLEFYKRAALPSSARAYATSNLTAFGGGNFDTLLSNPGNIVVGQTTYAIPPGQNGTHLSAAQLTPDAQNLQDRLAGIDLLPSQKRLSLYSSGKQALTERVSLFGNALVSQREAFVNAGGFATSLQVPSSNPFYVNPTGGTAPVTVDYDFMDDLGPRYNDISVFNTNATLGLQIDTGAAWKLTMYGNYAQEKENQFAGGQVNTPALDAALADSNPDTAFNPFGDGSHTNPATLRAIAAGSRFYSDSKLKSVEVNADGPLVRLPGGALKLAVGFEHRIQVFDSVIAASAVSPEIGSNLARDVTSAFAEITVPIFGPDNGAAGYRHLEVCVAGRFEDYSDLGSSTSPKLGMRWAPWNALAFRGTWGRSIRAPTMSDRDTTQNAVYPYVLPDGRSATGQSAVLIESGNNAKLTVEHARSWTTGFDLNPHEWLSGLVLSGTYFDISFQNRIDSPPLSSNILNDPTLAYIVTRDPTAQQIQSACSQGMFIGGTPEDCTKVGAAAILDARIQNIASLRTRGIDLRATYERSWSAGTLRAGLDGTYLFEFTETEGPDSPAAQLLNTQNNPINLKLKGSLSWSQSRWGATLGVNFQNSYTDVASQPQRNIRAYTTLDTQIRYELAPLSTGPLRNTRVELNAINIFNTSPPFLNNSIAGLGYDQENADPYGRLLSIQVRKTW